MATAETARLIASLELKDQFSGTANKAVGSLGKLDAAVSRSGGRAYKAGTQIGTGIKNGALIAAGAIGFLATNVAIGLKSLEQLEVATTQTNAVLKSTKSAAGQTADSIRDLAEKYESLNATIDDKVIQSGENLLLTFTNIRKEAFEPTLLAALNMNKALGGGEEGLQGAVQKLGKALNDPIKGLGLLSKVGITFTAQQKEQIKTAIDAGDTFKAQGIILAELDKRFGGSFLAGGNTTQAKVAKFRDSIEDLQKVLAAGMLPVIGKVADALSKFLADRAVLRGVEDLGKSIAGLFNDKNLATGADFLKGAFQTAKEAAPIVADAARATFGMVQAAVGLFKSLPPELQKLAVGAFAVNKLTGGLVTNIGGAIAGGLASFLAKSFTGGMNVNAGVVNVNGAAGLASGAVGGGGGGLLGTVAKVAIPVAIVSMAAEVAFAIADIGNPKHQNPDKPGSPITRTSFDVDDRITNALAVIARLEERKQSGGLTPFEQKQLDGQRALLAQLQRGQKPSSDKEDRDLVAATRVAGDKAAMDARRIEAAENRTGTKVSHTISVLGAQFGKDIRGLKAATKPVDIAKFAKAIAASVQKGSGSVAGTKGVLKDLKIKLAETHDPQLQKVLRAAIHTVEAKLPNRTWVDKELALGRKIAGSNESQTRKLADLKTIEASLRAHGDRHAASTIRKLEQQITATKGVKTAALETRQAVKDKDLSVTIPITNQVSVTNKSITKVQTTYKKISGFIE